jgi:thioredoxin-dependent peroxiredoxin
LKMTRFLALAAGLLLATSITTAYAADNAPATMPEVGKAAPKFTLPSQDGTPVSLKDFKGKWVVLYFYPKDMTTGCTIEAHKFQDALPQFEAKHAVILGVSVDTKESHQQFCTKDSLTFRLLSDTDHSVVSAYGSVAEFRGNTMAARNTFLINPKGKIVKVWTKVNPSSAASDVLAALP